jgi:hypothetical protein
MPVLRQVLEDLEAFDLGVDTLLLQAGEEVVLQVVAELRRLEGQRANLVVHVARRGLARVAGGLVQEAQLQAPGQTHTRA